MTDFDVVAVRDERVAERILLVEDDAALGPQVCGWLREGGFDSTWIADGDEALDIELSPFHLVILDLMLPGAYGLDVLKRFRLRSELPVLILSARNDTDDKVRALQLGADDYLTKPFWPNELLARVQARLRRPTMARAGLVEVGDLTIDVAARQVTVAGRPIDMTRIEFALLAALARRPGAAVSRTWLIQNVLDPERSEGERSVDVHISRMRKKLGSSRILTVWGIGYRLRRESDP